MSKWDEAHTEPLHDHPAEKDQLVAAMEAAGYVLDTLESTEDNLRFYGAYGNLLTMGGWHECEEWLNGVVFDDPQVSDRVEIILHPERFPERDPQRAALRAVEDSVEQNDNHFDGVINNQPQLDPAEILRQNARESEASEERRSVLEALKERQEYLFTGLDMGSLMHRSLELFDYETKEAGLSEATARRLIKALKENEIIVELAPHKGSSPAVLAFPELLRIVEGVNISVRHS